MKSNSANPGSFVLVFLCGVLVAAYGYYQFVTGELPKLEAEEQVQETELVNQRTELQRVRAFQQNIEQVKLRLKELNLKLEIALESMPKDYDMSGILRKFTSIAGTCSLELNSFKPGLTTKKEPNQFYETMEVSFSLKGPFTGTLLFLDQISRLKRVIKIENLRINLSANPLEREYASTGVPVATTIGIKLFRFVD